MEKTLKEAADSLLQRNEITKDQYDSLEIEKTGAGPLRTFVSKAIGGFGKGLSSVTKNVGEYGGGVFAGLAAAALAKELIVDPISGAMQTGNSYNQLMQKTPQLQSQDPGVVKDYFNIIKTYSPKVAANPMVAGALINKMIEFGGVDHKLIMDLMDMQSKVPPMAIPLMMSAGTKALGEFKAPSVEKPELKNKFTFRTDNASFERKF